jgi:DNA-binding GntR family transcriptional regulator
MADTLVRTMSAQVAARIREKILTGAYAPGAPLLQDSIANELGVSKIPVREALVSLRAEGLVDLFAHRGFQVRPLSASEVDEVFELRLQVEPDAVAAGARQALPEDRRVARECLDQLNETLAAKRLMNAGDLNRAFHLSLVVPRVRPVTFEILTRLHTLSQRYVRIHLVPEGRIRRARREHEALYEAWVARKSNEARRLTRRHIEETRDELAAALPPA